MLLLALFSSPLLAHSTTSTARIPVTSTLPSSQLKARTTVPTRLRDTLPLPKQQVMALIRMDILNAHVDATPPAEEASIPRLGAYLVRRAINDAERVYCLYRWVTRNIKYDHKGLEDMRNRLSTEPCDVLVNRITVCEGYARLMDSLSYHSGVRVRYQTGIARGVGYSKHAMRQSGHAWNTAVIDGRSYLLDATWGAFNKGRKSMLTYEQFAFLHYFLIAPEDMIYTHLPEKAEKQFLRTPITAIMFQELPDVSFEWFYYACKLLQLDTTSILAGSTRTITMQIADSIPLTIYFVADYPTQGTSFKPKATMIRSGSTCTITLQYAGAGEYTLKVFTSLRSPVYSELASYHTPSASEKVGNTSKVSTTRLARFRFSVYPATRLPHELAQLRVPRHRIGYRLSPQPSLSLHGVNTSYCHWLADSVLTFTIKKPKNMHIMMKLFSSEKEVEPQTFGSRDINYSLPEDKRYTVEAGGFCFVSKDGIVNVSNVRGDIDIAHSEVDQTTVTVKVFLRKRGQYELWLYSGNMYSYVHLTHYLSIMKL